MRIGLQEMNTDQADRSYLGRKAEACVVNLAPHRTVLGTAGRIRMMARPLTADDIITLAASLPDRERIQLLRWIASPHGRDASAYSASPAARDEFSGDAEPIAWGADGWDDFR